MAPVNNQRDAPIPVNNQRDALTSQKRQRLNKKDAPAHGLDAGVQLHDRDDAGIRPEKNRVR